MRDPVPSTLPSDAVADVKSRVMNELLARLGTRMNDISLTEEQLHDIVRDELGKIVDAQNLLLAPEERRQILQEVADDVLGFGPLQRLLDDATVTEIMVNGPDTIYVEQHGKLDAAPPPASPPRSTCAG